MAAPNAMAEIRATLQQIGVGEEICSQTLIERLPHIPHTKIQAYVSILANDKYDMLRRSTKVGRRQFYRIKPEIHRDVSLKGRRYTEEERAARGKAPSKKPGRKKALASEAPAEAKPAAKTKPAKKTKPAAEKTAAKKKPAPSSDGQLRRHDGPPPLDHDDERPLMHKMVALMCEWGVGQVVKNRDVAERIPGTTPSQLSPNFAQLASPEMGCLTRVGKNGVEVKFRIEREMLHYHERRKEASRKKRAESEPKARPDDADAQAGDDSTMAQVHAFLAELGPGQEVTMAKVHEHLSWLKRNDVSAALAMLSYPQYGVLTKLDKIGNVRPYRIEKDVFKPIRHHKRPKWANKDRDPDNPKTGVASISWAEERRQFLDERKRIQCSDLLLEAADAVERGDYETTNDLMKRCYKLLHPKRRKRAQTIEREAASG